MLFMVRRPGSLEVKDQLPPLADLKRAASAAWPGRSFSRFRVVEEGWSHLVLEADREVMFRFPRWREVARSVGYEVRLLEYLRPRLSVRIPEPRRVGVLSQPRGWPFLSYRKIPGVALSEVGALPPPYRRRVRDCIARLLRELASLPRSPMLRLGVPRGDGVHWVSKYHHMLDRYERRGSARLPTGLDRKVIEEFDRGFQSFRDSRFRPVVTHLDLGPYNILWSEETHQATGVIDWEDTRFGDPAFDLAGLTFLGSRLLEPIARARKRPEDRTFYDRLEFYRRVVPLQEMLFAIETRRAVLFRQKVRELRELLAPDSVRGLATSASWATRGSKVP